jgi:hypothetical protein
LGRLTRQLVGVVGKGRAKLSDYAAWLEQMDTSVPGRQTLYMDLRRYCQACDGAYLRVGGGGSGA